MTNLDAVAELRTQVLRLERLLVRHHAVKVIVQGQPLPVTDTCVTCQTDGYWLAYPRNPWQPVTH